MARSSGRALPLLLLLAAAAAAAAGAAAQSATSSSSSTAAAPLRLAIVNQVHFHLEVVAGAMHVLKDFSSGPLTVYLPAKVCVRCVCVVVFLSGARAGSTSTQQKITQKKHPPQLPQTKKNEKTKNNT